MDGSDYLCSSFSLLAGEDLAGTASRGEVWFLLEYDGYWGVKAFEESAVPYAVKQHLSTLLDNLPGARLLLIRQPPVGRLRLSDTTLTQTSRKNPGFSFFVAIAREAFPLLYSFQLSGYEDLLHLDLEGLVTGAKDYAAHLSQQPMFLVCTNGRRDRCCARFGTHIYELMTRAAQTQETERWVWQCTHMGGHRFAPNILCFPHGIYYGRVEQADVVPLMEMTSQGNYFLEKARGRACYSPVVQMAEIYLRRQTGALDLDQFRLRQVHEVSHSIWRVEFSSLYEEVNYELHISARQSDVLVYKSCSQSDMTPVVNYELLSIERQTVEGEP